MSLASNFEPYDRDKALYDREEWEVLFEKAIEQAEEYERQANPEVAESGSGL